MNRIPLRFGLVIVIVVFFALQAPDSTYGQIPQTINFQGILADDQGNPVPDGSFSILVSLYGVAEGGVPLWSERHPSVELSGGLLNVTLGSVEPLTLPFDAPYWLGVTIGAEPELDPRLALTAVPYSLNTRAIVAEPVPGSSLAVRNASGETTHLLSADGTALHTGRVTAEGGIDIPGGAGKSASNAIPPSIGLDSFGTDVGVRGTSENGTGVVGESENGPAGQFMGDLEVLNAGMVILDDVAIVQEGDLTPPEAMEDENARVLIWSQADKVVRYISLAAGDSSQADTDWVEDIIGDQVYTGRKIVLRSGGDVFRVSNADAAGTPRVFATSNNGKGVEAKSGNADGVHGESTNGDGVHGLANANGDGVLGESKDGDGVHGLAQIDGDGVYGESLGNGRGVYGVAKGTGEGVLGESRGAGDAVRGDAKGNGAGIRGSSVGGLAGRFQGDVDIQKDAGGGVGHLKLEDIENTQQANPTRFLLRDGDGVVREAKIPSGGAGGDDDWVDSGVNGTVHTVNKSIILKDGGGADKFTVSNGLNPVLRLESLTDNDAILGKSTASGIGVRGESSGGDGVKGQSGSANIQARTAGVFGKGTAASLGVKGESDTKDGVHGKTDGDLGATNVIAGVHGEADQAYGVLARSRDEQGVHSTSIKKSAVYGMSEELHGVEGVSNGVNIQARTAGVFGKGTVASLGVKGESDTKDGVHGKTDGDLGATNVIAGVQGEADQAYGVRGRSRDEEGVYGISTKKSGVYGTSTELHGVEGFVKLGNKDIAGVKGMSEAGQSGVYGVSNLGPGVRGTSEMDFAGRFDGEVHITDTGTKKSKLKIDMMEDDNTAPCLVWSGPESVEKDKYVRKRKCWTLEEDVMNSDTTTYMVSEFGIRVKGGDEGTDVVFEVNSDGTSTHKGLEKFEMGIQVVDSTKTDSVLIDMTQGEMMVKQRFSVKNPAGARILDVNPADPYGVKISGTGTMITGPVMIVGTLTATGAITGVPVIGAPKPFTIDHPLDPANRLLRHFSIESPDVLNMYTGNARLDKNGEAWAELPAYFEIINSDYRYQLTSIGAPGPNLYIAVEIANNRFKIAGGEPGAKVSWEVSALRDDPAMRWRAPETEELKPEDERGTFLLPEHYGAKSNDD